MGVYMVTSQGRLARQIKGRGCFGIVEIDLDPDSAVISIDVKTHGEGYRGEGDFEGIPAQGYEDWKQGAVLGVAFALWTAGQSGCAVVITKIVGTNADTTP